MSSLLEVGYTDVVLLAILGYVVYFMFFKKTPVGEPERPTTPPLPAFPMQDMTVDELRKYNGVEDERILVGVAGRVSHFCGFVCYRRNLDLRCHTWKVVLRSRQRLWNFGRSRCDTFVCFIRCQGCERWTRRLGRLEWVGLARCSWVGGTFPRFDWFVDFPYFCLFSVKYPYVGRLLKPGEKSQDYDGKDSGVKFGELKPIRVVGTSFTEG